MLVESVRKQLIEKLEKEKENLVLRIDKLEVEAGDVRANKRDFEKGSLASELSNIDTRKDSLASRLERVVIRLKELREFQYHGLCPLCGQDIAENDILETPTITFCASCGMKRNGIK